MTKRSSSVKESTKSSKETEASTNKTKSRTRASAMEDPSDVMVKRWIKHISKKVPTVDLIDFSNEVRPEHMVRQQTAPVYSQSAYMSQLDQDIEVGDYIEKYSETIRNYSRQQIVLLIEDLHGVKGYKLETLFTAVSLADRYLLKLLADVNEKTCLVTVAVTSLLFAAKIEEETSPSFERMIILLQDRHSIALKASEIIELEAKIIRTLDFQLRTVSPIFFLERFLRLFGIVKGHMGHNEQVIELAE